MIPRWLVVLAWHMLYRLIDWTYGPPGIHVHHWFWGRWLDYWNTPPRRWYLVQWLYSMEDYAMDRGWQPWRGPFGLIEDPGLIEEYENLLDYDPETLGGNAP